MPPSSLSWQSSKILQEKISSSHPIIEIQGHASIPTLAASLSDLCSLTPQSHIIVVPSLKEASHLKDDLHFFAPSIPCEILSYADISPYSGLPPSNRMAPERLRWLHLANQNQSQCILIAPIQSFLQKTLPHPIFEAIKQKWSVGDDISLFSKTLENLGYTLRPLVEDIGQFSIRGGILDVYTPSHRKPVRIELFGDTIDSLRFFNLEDQRSQEKVNSIDIIPCQETLYDDDQLESTIGRFHQWRHPQAPQGWIQHQVLNFSQKRNFPGFEFYLPLVWANPGTPISFIHPQHRLWMFDSFSVERSADNHFSQLKIDRDQASTETLQYPLETFYKSYDENKWFQKRSVIHVTKISTRINQDEDSSLRLQSSNPVEIQALHKSKDTSIYLSELHKKITMWHEQSYFIFACIGHHNQFQRIENLFKQINISYKTIDTAELHWNQWSEEQSQSVVPLVHLLPGQISETFRNKEDRFIFLREKDIIGQKALANRKKTSHQSFQESASVLSFGDLKTGDNVVHREHGIGIYEGLKIMSIQGVESELIEITYKDKDKLYVPIYRIGLLQKYSGPQKTIVLDRLGNSKWQETKAKTQKHLRDLASELLKIYAQRTQARRDAFSPLDQDYQTFEEEFPYSETKDQQKAIYDIQEDLSKKTPMDRLLCGDVGFGKTEVAMRASFRVIKDRKQVIILAPTTVLTFQHYESFTKRFAKWPVSIHLLNRFISSSETKKTIESVNRGDVDILIGTHKILNSKIQTPHLGLLVIDEEQKFGVAHKEKIRKFKNAVDTLAMSATPIPRTLNLSLSGLRDLSLINTAPLNRQPIRTFVTRFDKETLRKAVLAERARDGQIFFLHNRVQSIHEITNELKELLPDVRIAIGHGQMDEKNLEKTIMSFYRHEIDLLVCTTIIESGIDIPKANTIFINNAQMFGLSQLYQLRGRVGRSAQKAYCYLLIPQDRPVDPLAQERLRVIQENTSFGSGLLIAQYDLELRGAGNILGQDQSGQIASIGYELYMDLLKQEIQRLRGEPLDENDIEPEINLRMMALIPQNYIADVRIRLAYYKKLTQIKSENDADLIEDELKDRFGPLPEPAVNLIGLMLIRHICKRLHIRDLTSGKKNLALVFREDTPVKAEKILNIVDTSKGKVTLVSNHKVAIKMSDMSWPLIYETVLQFD